MSGWNTSGGYGTVNGPQGPSGPYAPPGGPNPPKKHTGKIVAWVVVAVLVLGGGGFGAWALLSHRNQPQPAAAATSARNGSTSATSGGNASCWDGSSNPCPDFAGKAAVQYAFAPPDPGECKVTALDDIDMGEYFSYFCTGSAASTYITGTSASAYIELWKDKDAIARWNDKHGYQKDGILKNGDGDDVGTTYSYTSDGYTSTISCYDDIPVCLRSEDSASVLAEFKTLSKDQIQRVATWLGTHPVADPTASWDVSTAEKAFPPAAGFKPIDCTSKMATTEPDSDADQQFDCNIPTDGAVLTDATITRWPSAQDAAKAFKNAGYTEKGPWMVDGTQRGTIFTGAVNQDAYCYSDAPFCIDLNRFNEKSPDDLMTHIAPLTADQAADLMKK